MFIDVSQQESAVALIGGELLAYQMTGREPERRGNRSTLFAPHNTYRCAGEDRWVTIAVTSDEEWQHLAHIIGERELATESRFATNAGRLQHQDELDQLISQWTATREPYAISWLLQKAGIHASPVLSGPDLLADSHYTTRGTFVTVNHPQVGPRWYPGIAWKMSATPGQVRWPAPTLGQHNHQVYGELLGLSHDENVALEEKGIIGTKPTGSRII
jgi:benzylsuccinate CoA-transferase BbsF subunit